MALCNGGGTQCTAPAACAPGWHMCLGSEYLARGGSTQSLGAYGGWLAACVRNGPDAGLAYLDHACEGCDGGTSGSIMDGTFSCQTGQDLSNQVSDSYLGLVSLAACHRLVTNDPSMAGYWTVTSSNLSYLVLCCR